MRYMIPETGVYLSLMIPTCRTCTVNYTVFSLLQDKSVIEMNGSVDETVNHQHEYVVVESSSMSTQMYMNFLTLITTNRTSYQLGIYFMFFSFIS